MLHRRMNGLFPPPPASGWRTRLPARIRAYRSKPAKSADATTWVQIDLGENRPIDFVKIYPANEKDIPGRDEQFAGEGFPVRFKIECSSDPDFHHSAVIVDHSDADYPNPEGRIEKYSAHGVAGRYVRLLATRLMEVAGGGFSGVAGGYYLALGKLEVYSGGKEIATSCPVTGDSNYGNDYDLAQVTRPARPGGETTRVDNPENVTASSTWKPPVPKAQVPRTGVQLEGGVFQTALENNIAYLLNSYSVDDLLRQFRERVGTAKPPAESSWRRQVLGRGPCRFERRPLPDGGGEHPALDRSPGTSTAS